MENGKTRQNDTAPGAELLARGDASNGAGGRGIGPVLPDLFSAPPSRPTPVDPNLNLTALMRWKWTILSVFAASAVAALLLIWTTVEPQYSSTAVVRIASVVPRVLYKTEDNGTVPLFNAYINTQVSVIQSPEVLARVFERDDVKGTEWYKAVAANSDDPQRLVDKLSRLISVSIRRGTELVDISVDTDAPRDAATLVNAVAEEYKKFWDKSQAESDRQRVATLRQQLEDVQKNINDLFEKKFAVTEKMGSWRHEEVRAQLLEDLNNKKAALVSLHQDEALRKLEAQERKSLYGGLEEPVGADLLDDVRLDRIPTDVQNDATWIRHQEEYVDAKKRLELAKAQFGESHPSLHAAVADVEQARRMLRLTEQRLGLEPMSFVSNPEYAKRREEELGKSISDLQTQIAEADGLSQDLAKTEEQYSEQKLMRKDLMDRLNALETESNAPARVSIQSPGLVKLQPARDQRMIFSACAIVAALMGAVGIGYIRGRTDPKIHEFSDISTDMPRDVPFLGQLPRARNILEQGEDTLIGQSVNENIRIIRTMLLQRLGGRGAVAITSPAANTGKTTIAILLARSLASMGKRVLLVDVDMLHPSVSMHFGMFEAPGLRGLLKNKISEADAIQHTDIAGLDVLPIGKRNGTRDNDVLAQGGFSAAIQQWKSEYDVVLLDTPPVLSMADARITAACSDGAVMVLRASNSRREDAVEAFAGLSATGARLLGTLLVGVSTGSAYYPYYYHQRDMQATELLA